jgi:hypothetical protein
MSVYVDDPIWQLGRMKMCHMIADTLEQLHAMADYIGVARRHFQAHARIPHYDICKSKRTIAIGAGAQALNRREFVQVMRRIREAKKAAVA